jgi:hypothetical protein
MVDGHFDPVAIRILKIERTGDSMVVKAVRHSRFPQFIQGPEEALVIGPEAEVAHGGRRGLRKTASVRQKGNAGPSGTKKGGIGPPFFLEAPLEAEHLSIPEDRPLDIRNRNGHMVKTRYPDHQSAQKRVI